MQHSFLPWWSGLETSKHHVGGEGGGATVAYTSAHTGQEIFKFTCTNTRWTFSDVKNTFYVKQQRWDVQNISCNIWVEVFMPVYFHCLLKNAQHVRDYIAVWKIHVISPPLILSVSLVSWLKGGVGVSEGRGWRRSLWCDYKDTQQASGERWKRRSRSKIDPGGKAKGEGMHWLFFSATYRG